MTFIKENNDSNLIIEENVTDFPLHIKIGFRRKLLGTIAGHLTCVSIVTSILKFTPLARFYINENEWILQLLYILIILIHIALLLKRNEYNINVFLLFIHMVLQISVAATFVTFYDLLGVLQGLFLTTSALSLLFLSSLLFGKSCDLHIALFFSCLLILSTTMSFQMVFGCTIEELITSVSLSMCLSFYYLYAVNLSVNSVSYEKYGIALINVYTWPFIYLSTKIKILF